MAVRTRKGAPTAHLSGPELIASSRFGTSEACDRRIQAGQAGGGMSNRFGQVGRARALAMYADWTDRITASSRRSADTTRRHAAGRPRPPDGGDRRGPGTNPPCPACPILDSMKISLDLPDDVVRQLVEEGQDLSRAALEALAIDAYRMDRITGYQLRELLDIPSRYDLDGFLKRHGVPLEYTIDDFEREGETSARLREKRHSELAHPPS